METDGRFWPHHGQGGYPDAHLSAGTSPGHEVGMDAQVPQLVIDGS